MSGVGCEQAVLPNIYAGSRQQVSRSACVPLRVRRLQRKCTCITPTASLSVEVAAPSAPENLIAWLQGHDPITHSVTVDFSASDMGRRLTAVRDVPADSPVLSVPLSNVFSDVEVSSSPMGYAQHAVHLQSYDTLLCRKTRTHTFLGVLEWQCACCSRGCCASRTQYSRKACCAHGLLLCPGRYSQALPHMLSIVLP